MRACDHWHANALECLVEAGLGKLQRDYSHYLVGTWRGASQGAGRRAASLDGGRARAARAKQAARCSIGPKWYASARGVGRQGAPADRCRPLPRCRPCALRRTSFWPPRARSPRRCWSGWRCCTACASCTCLCGRPCWASRSSGCARSCAPPWTPSRPRWAGARIRMGGTPGKDMGHRAAHAGPAASVRRRACSGPRWTPRWSWPCRCPSLQRARPRS